MMDRNSEFDAFKSINLSQIASAYGYQIDRKKSTRHSVLMSNGQDKIVISRNRGHYVYFSVHDPASAGTAIDFAQRVIEPGCSLGRVRQLLRPFLGGGFDSTPHTQRDHYQEDIRPNEPDLAGVAARYARFEPIDEPHPYLCVTRGVPFELLRSQRLAGRVRHCPRRGSIVFPHWGGLDEADAGADTITGYEIKGRGVNLFSKGGRKGLWMSGGSPGDRTLAFAESGLDCLSYLAVRGEEGTQVGSISGQMNRQQPLLIRAAIGRMGEGSRIVAAFDNDLTGDTLAARLRELVAEAGRSDLVFYDDRPRKRGQDWNNVAVEQFRSLKGIIAAAPAVKR